MDEDEADHATRRIGFAESAGASRSGPVSGRQAAARAAPRSATGQFLKQGDGPSWTERRRARRVNGSKPGAVPRRKSKISNVHALFFAGNATTAQARRFADILAQIISDLGGSGAPLSEGQRQLARRAAALSVSCEVLEQSILTGTSAAEAQLQAATGGLSSFTILKESSRVLHAVARTRGGDTIPSIAKLPDAALDRVTDLLCRAGDLAAKAIAAGSAATADLEMLGLLSDRLGRTFGRLGLARTPREINAIDYSRAAAQRNVFSPLREALKQQDAQPVDADPDRLEPIEVSEAADG